MLRFIRTGDLLLFQGTTLLSRFIRWGSESPYSHCGLALWWDARLMLMQATDRGVHVLPVERVLAQYDGQVDWWQPCEALRGSLDVERLKSAALDELGKPFGAWPMAALVARMFRRKELGRDDPAGMRDDSYFCSQLVGRCYRRVGVDLVAHKADRDLSPGDLARSPHLVFRGVLRPHVQGVCVQPALPAPSARAALPEGSEARAA